jgi:predicted DNA binding CopG/RHH family protein
MKFKPPAPVSKKSMRSVDGDTNPSATNKETQMTLRLSDEDKTLIERLARSRGLNKSSLLLSLVYKDARDAGFV